MILASKPMFLSFSFLLSLSAVFNRIESKADHSVGCIEKTVRWLITKQSKTPDILIWSDPAPGSLKCAGIWNTALSDETNQSL